MVNGYGLVVTSIIVVVVDVIISSISTVFALLVVRYVFSSIVDDMDEDEDNK